MKFKLLKKFESPYATMHPGIIKTAQEWGEIFSIPESDIAVKKDWFLFFDETKYINVDLVDINELNENYSKLLYTITVDFPHLSFSDICRIASYVLGVCSSCYNENKNCNCFKDE